MSETSLPPPERELLTAHVLGKNRAWVLAHPEHSLTPRQSRALNRLLRRRGAGEPLAYLTRTKEFYGRSFTVGRGVLVPRPETEHLIEAALKIIPERSTMTVADIGTGSGCIAITLAMERPNIRLIATDRSSHALHFAKVNAKRYHLLQRIRFRTGHLLTPLRNDRLIPDLIVANLPYATPEEYRAVRAEPKSAIVGGRDGLAVFRKFFRQLQTAGMTPTLILEIDPRRAPDVIALAHMTFWRATLTIQRDLAGWPRVVIMTPAAYRDAAQMPQAPLPRRLGSDSRSRRQPPLPPPLARWQLQH